MNVQLNNRTGATFLGIAALLYLYNTKDLAFGSLSSPDIGFFPMIIGIALLVGSITFFLQSLVLSPPQKGMEAEKKEEQKRDQRKLRLFAGCLLTYPFFLEQLGFVTSTISLLVVAFIIMEFRGILGSLLSACLAVFLVYFIFGNWFGVSFPKGFLG